MMNRTKKTSVLFVQRRFVTMFVLLCHVAFLLCAGGTVRAGMVYVNSGFDLNGTINASAGSSSISFDAGATADLLIVGTSTEFGNGTPGGWNVTYDGNPMTWATGNGTQNNIFYLDLTQTNYTGGNAILALSWDYTDGGDLGIAWVSIRETSDGPITLHSTGASNGTNVVDLVTTTNGTFNFVNFNANKAVNPGTPAVDAPLTQIYVNKAFGSNAGGAGYEVNVSAGTNSYSWTYPDAGRRIDAVAFTSVALPDATPPEITDLSPLDNAGAVLADSDLVATFDEFITLQSGGTVTVTDLTDGSSTTVITLPDGRVTSPNGNDLLINLSSDLDLASDYSIRISTNAVADGSSNYFAGITNDTTWDFTTSADTGVTYLWTGDIGTDLSVAGNWSVGGSSPASAPTALNNAPETPTIDDRLVFDSNFWTRSPPELYTRTTAMWGSIIVKNGTVNYKNDGNNQGNYSWGGTDTFIVGDDDATAATLNLNVVNWNQGGTTGTKTYVIYSDGRLISNRGGTHNWSNGATYDTVMRVIGGQVIIDGELKESDFVDPDDYVVFETEGSTFTFNKGSVAGQFQALADVESHMGNTMSFRPARGHEISVVDNGSTFTITATALPAGTVIIVR
jgi:hypothetical protein